MAIKWGFFAIAAIAKRRALARRLFRRNIGLFTDVNRLIQHIFADVIEEGLQLHTIC